MSLIRMKVVAVFAAICSSVALAAAPEQVPTAPQVSAFSRLSQTQQGLVRVQSKYHVSLPDGRVLNAYRLLRAMELLDKTGEIARDSKIEAMDPDACFRAKEDPKKRKIVWEEIPDWIEDSDGIWVVGPCKGMVTTWDSSSQKDGVLIVSIKGTNLAIRNPTSGLKVPSDLDDVFLLVADGKSHQNGTQSYTSCQVVKPTEVRASAEQLAEYLTKASKPLKTYDDASKTVQPMRKQKRGGSGSGWVETKSVPDGPAITTYKWTEKRIPLRLKATASSSPAVERDSSDKK